MNPNDANVVLLQRAAEHLADALLGQQVFVGLTVDLAQLEDELITGLQAKLGGVGLADEFREGHRPPQSRSTLSSNMRQRIRRSASIAQPTIWE